jgi:FkbM family methyltransferase
VSRWFTRQQAPPDPAPPLPFGMDAALTGLRARGVQPATVFDIGASNGAWTVVSALPAWPQSTFHLFEPLAAHQETLGSLREANADRVVIHSVGLSDSEGELSLGVTEDLWGSSFAYKGASTQLVKVRTLDAMLHTNEIPEPDFVKIDVQGFERRVIRGGQRALSKCGFVLMECSFYPFCAEMCRLDESIAFMAERGFAPYEFIDFLRRPADGAMGQCDILFIRREHALMRDTRWA